MKLLLLLVVLPLFLFSQINIPFRSAGPTVMSGRVVDLDVDPADPTHFYVAYASGGLWETRNNGISFEPIFDNEKVMTIGDIAVDWSSPKHTIWVGTGEVNSSRSSYAGNGVYRSDDNGKSWNYLGLPESHHIGRIVLHPKDHNKAWVAVLGHLYTKNAERGVFFTADGGKTWSHQLSVAPNTGAVDLAINTNKPDELYAALWERERTPWNFIGSGEHSGIYKTTDGGATWKLTSGPNSGFPYGTGCGRIGLDIHPMSGKIFAVVDNQFPKNKESKKKVGGLQKGDFKGMGEKDFDTLKDEDLNTFLKKHNFPEQYSAQTVKALVMGGKIKPVALLDFLEDANTQLFETEVIGAEVYVSSDGGTRWERTHKDNLDDVFFTYGYYFAQIRTSQSDPSQLYVMGVPIIASSDGGKTWKSLDAENVHVDHHALWVNPNRPGHLVNGNDGGLNISYDNGENWLLCNSPAVGQCYAVGVDSAANYSLYAGFQDNGVWTGPSSYKAGPDWHQTGNYPYKFLLWGDGFQIQVDPRDNQTIYTGFQFGNYYRINKTTGKQHSIKPKHSLGERPLRFNWQTPILLSTHNPDIVYLGSNFLHRSMDKGNTWVKISKDLTTGGKIGNVPYGTITTISESKMQFGLIYVGTDDGRIHFTKDGGVTWKDVTPATNVKNLWVTRVVASTHDVNTVYVTLNGYRYDHFSPYLFVSHNNGHTWEQLGKNLPNEPLNVVREDPVNRNLLFVGSDNGLYVSLDRGRSFYDMGKGYFPRVAVHDLAIHAGQKELVVGTHGRSIYILPIAHLQQLKGDLLAKELHVFSPKAATYNARWGNASSKWKTPDTPMVYIGVWAQKEYPKAKLIVEMEKGPKVSERTISLQKGFQLIPYDLVVDGEYKDIYLQRVPKGIDGEFPKPSQNGKVYLSPDVYELKLKAEGERAEGVLKVLDK